MLSALSELPRSRTEPVRWQQRSVVRLLEHRASNYQSLTTSATEHLRLGEPRSRNREILEHRASNYQSLTTSATEHIGAWMSRVAAIVRFWSVASSGCRSSRNRMMIDLPETLVEFGITSIQTRIPRDKSSYVWILPPVFYDSCANGILEDVVDGILIDACFAFV